MALHDLSLHAKRTESTNDGHNVRPAVIPVPTLPIAAVRSSSSDRRSAINACAVTIFAASMPLSDQTEAWPTRGREAAQSSHRRHDVAAGQIF